MCFTVDQIDRACGLLLLNEFNTFVYCCKKCTCEFDSGPNLEVHILSEHQDDKVYIEKVFLINEIFVDGIKLKSEECYLEQQVESNPTTSAVSIQLESTRIKTEEFKENDDKSRQINGNLEQKQRKISVAKRQNKKNAEKSRAKIEQTIEQNTKESHSNLVKKQQTKSRKSVRKRNTKVFYCDMCPGTIFNLKNNLRNHMRVHIENGFKKTCPICKKKPSNYEKHMKMNHTDRPYRCDYCEKSFRSNQNRKSHQRTHTGEKPYLCSVCGKAFKSHALQHNHQKRLHSQIRPHSCKECDRSFVTPCLLKDHFYSFHSDVRPYTCDVCGKSYSTKKYLRTHKAFHSDKTHQCKYCEKQFKSSQARRFHERTLHQVL